MIAIINSTTDALLGDETSEEFNTIIKRLSRQDIEAPGTKAALGFYKAANEEKRIIRELLGIEEMTWQKLRRRDYPQSLKVYQPEGRAIYRAYKVPEHMIIKLQQKLIEEIRIKDPSIDADEVSVIGNYINQLVLPAEVVDQLQKIEQPRSPNLAEIGAAKLIGMWKVQVLLWVKRLIPYNIRNFFGDVDPVLAAAPLIGFEVPKAMRLLRDFHKLGKGEKYLIDDALSACIDNAVMGSGWSGAEMPNPKQQKVLEELYMEATKEGSRANPVLWARKYFNVARGLTEFRENVLRVAAFLYYQKQLNAGTLNHFGTSRKHVVLGIQKSMGTDVAAAKLARDLLGDYSNRTALGNWLRGHLIPFHAFTEINAQRWPMLMLNAYSAATTSPEQAAKNWGVASGAITMAVLTTRMGMLGGLVMLFNNMVFGDDEDELPPHEKENLHIILGRNSDGTIRVFRRLGAVGDFLELFGLNAGMALIPYYKAGQVDGMDIMEAMAKASVNKLVNGFGPLKTVVEVGTGLSFFPDVFNPRPIDRLDHSAGLFGLQDEMRWAKGMILGEGDRARPHYFQRHLVSVDDPRQAALSSMYGLRQKFLESKGLDRPSPRIRSAIRKLKWAVMNDDYEAFKEAKATYLKKPDQTYKSFSSALRYLDPIDQRLKHHHEVEFEREFLTEQQRGQLQMARDYSQDLRSQMFNWWMTDAKEKKGEVGLTEALEREVSAKVKTLTRGKPVKARNQSQWRMDQRRAAKWLKERKIGRGYILRQYEGGWEGKDRLRRNLTRSGL